MINVVPNYKHDIFMSYAHVDNEPFMGVKHGWVSNLFRALTVSLTTKISDVNVTSRWQAVQSEDNDIIPSAILQDLEQSAILLVILSPGYLASELCMEELQLFVQQLESQPDRPLPRVFVVEKNKIEPTTAPELLSRQPRHRFWNPDGRGRARTFAFPQPDPSDALYYQKVDDLANDLAKALEEMRLASDPALSVASTPPLATVFLAYVTEDLRNERDGMKRYLEQFNIRVVPDQHDLSSADRYRAVLEPSLAESDAFVQLLGEQTQWDTSGEAVNWAQTQCEQARSHNLPILQWRSPLLDLSTVPEPTQRALLELETVSAMPLEEFKHTVRQSLTAKPASQPAADRYVFLNVSDEDSRLAANIGKILTQLGFEWHLRRNEGSPRTIRRELDFNLKTCDALIVVYGEIHAQWVIEQLTYYRRIRRAQPIKALALYDGPPEDKDDVQLSIPQMEVLDCRQGIDEVKLRNFLSSLLEVR